MFESPRSLQEVCVDFICDNVLVLCDLHPGDCGLPASPLPSAVAGEYSLIICFIQFFIINIQEYEKFIIYPTLSKLFSSLTVVIIIKNIQI